MVIKPKAAPRRWLYHYLQYTSAPLDAAFGPTKLQSKSTEVEALYHHIPKRRFVLGSPSLI